jgi:hypothetical protein
LQINVANKTYYDSKALYEEQTHIETKNDGTEVHSTHVSFDEGLNVFKMSFVDEH